MSTQGISTALRRRHAAMKPRDYIRRKDNPLITGVVIVMLAKDRALIRGPFREMTVETKDWEVAV